MQPLLTYRRNRDKLRFAALAFIATVAGTACGRAPAEQGAGDVNDVVVTVDSTIRYQTIEGWEAHPQSGQDGAAFPKYRDSLAFRAVNELGINRLRLPVWSGFENPRDTYASFRAGTLEGNYRCERFVTINDDDDPRHINWKGFHFSQLDAEVTSVVLPIKKQLEARGEKLAINFLYTAFVNQCPNTPYAHTTPEEYAEFIVAGTLHLRNRYGIVPDTWEIILEPDNTEFWRVPQMAAAIRAAGKRLKEAGFEPRFIVPSTARPRLAVRYFNELINEPGVRAYVAAFSYHRYGKVDDDLLRTIGTLGARHGISTQMLEHIGSDHHNLHADLKLANVGAWQQFALAYPMKQDDGAQHYLVSRDGLGSLRLASRSRYFRNYFKYVRRGAVRMEAGSSSATVDPIAFRNNSGRYVVIARTSGAGSFSIKGLPAGRYRTVFTGAREMGAESARRGIVAGGSFEVEVPAPGVITVFAD